MGNMAKLNDEVLDCFMSFTNNMDLIESDASVNIEEDLEIEDLHEWLEDDDGLSAEDDFLTRCSLLDNPSSESAITGFKNNRINASAISCNVDIGMETALKKLRESMRRTELSRIEILRQKNKINETSKTSTPPPMMNLNSFFTGKRKSLTTEVEESRKKLNFFVGRSKSLTSELDESRQKIRGIMRDVRKVNNIARMA